MATVKLYEVPAGGQQEDMQCRGCRRHWRVPTVYALATSQEEADTLYANDEVGGANGRIRMYEQRMQASP